MKTHLILLLVLCASSVMAAASTTNFLIVVGKDAPASDVVVGANFAASMKVSAATTFTSILDADAYAQVESLTGKVVVVIDGQGKEARILGNGNAMVRDAAKTYFTRMSYKVVESMDRKYLLLNPESAGTDEPADTPGTSLTPSEQPPKPTVETVVPETSEPTSDESAGGVAGDDKEGDKESAEKPGVFKRMWRWFKGLFS